MARKEANKERSKNNSFDWDKHETNIRELEKELKKISTPRIDLLNVSVYQKMLRAAAILELYVLRNPKCGTIDVKVIPERQLGKIIFEHSSLCPLPVWLIHELAKGADKCAETELCGGKRCLCVTFRHLFF